MFCRARGKLFTVGDSKNTPGLQIPRDWTLLGVFCILSKSQWSTIYEWSPKTTEFYTDAIWNTLSEPANLKKWSTQDRNSSALCSFSPATAEHVLGCAEALHEGRNS